MTTKIQNSNACSNCQKLPEEGKVFGKCARCRQVCYCSKECQAHAWKVHRTACEQLVEEHLPENKGLQLLVAVDDKDLEAVEQLLRVGASVNYSQNNVTPLAAAIEKEWKLAVDKLLSKGAHVNQRLNNGFLPIHAAVEKGSLPIVASLVKAGASVNHKASDSNCTAPLQIACLEGKYPVVEWLIDNGADLEVVSKGFKPLNIAIEKRDLKLVKILVERGAQVNAQQNISPVMSALSAKCLDIADYLIEKGADVNQSSPAGIVPLFVFAHMGDSKRVELCLEKGAKIDHRCKEGFPVMYYAIHGKSVQVVHLLCTAGADFTTPVRGLDMITLARKTQAGEIVKYLADKLGQKL